MPKIDPTCCSGNEIEIYWQDRHSTVEICQRLKTMCHTLPPSFIGKLWLQQLVWSTVQCLRAMLQRPPPNFSKAVNLPMRKKHVKGTCVPWPNPGVVAKAVAPQISPKGQDSESTVAMSDGNILTYRWQVMNPGTAFHALRRLCRAAKFVLIHGIVFQSIVDTPNMSSLWFRIKFCENRTPVQPVRSPCAWWYADYLRTLTKMHCRLHSRWHKILQIIAMTSIFGMSSPGWRPSFCRTFE